MKIVSLTSVILNILLVKLSVQAPTDVLKISLYYEALCPDCIEFIEEQLYPSYKKIGSSLLLDLNPYGNVRRKQENGTWVFNCQHGPDECAINKIQACGLARNNDQAKQLEYVFCVENHAEAHRKDLKKLAQCASKLGVSENEVLRCSQGPEGDKLFAKIADKQEALTPLVQHVPWIIFNDQPHNTTLEDQALDDFLKTACHILSNKPEGCSDFNQIPMH